MASENAHNTKILYLHIGTPKTGTTLLQKFFILNRALLKKNGICYPDSLLDDGKQENDRNGNMYPIANDIIDERFYCGLDAIKKIFETESKILLSEEHFWELNDKSFRLEELKKVVDEIKLIVYLRRQDLYVESFWNMFIGLGVGTTRNKNSCKEYLLEAFKTHYYEELESISEIVGMNNIYVRIFEKQQLVNENICDDFLHIMQCDKFHFNTLEQERVNESFDEKILEIKDVFNDVRNVEGVDWHNLENLFFNRAFREVNRKYGSNKSCLFTLGEREEIMQEYLEENEKLAEKYLKRKNGILFYEKLGETTFRENYWGENAIDILMLTRIIAEIFASQQKKIIELENRLNNQHTRIMRIEKIVMEREKINSKNCRSLLEKLFRKRGTLR